MSDESKISVVAESRKNDYKILTIISILWLLFIITLCGLSFFSDVYPITMGPPEPESQSMLWSSSFIYFGLFCMAAISLIIAIIVAFAYSFKKKGLSTIPATFFIVVIGAVVLAIFYDDTFFMFNLISLLVYLSAIAIPLSVFLFFKLKEKRLKFLMFLILVTFLPFAIFKVHRNIWSRIRHNAFVKLADRSSPLVEAIKRFESDHNEPPESLEMLVPDYISSIPGTMIRAYPEYEYEVFKDEQSESTLFWYDLGSRHGQDFVGLWVYIDGDPEHAIFVIIVNKQNVIDSIDVDRLPKKLPEESLSFDSEQWKSDTESRMKMIRQMWNNIEFVGKSLDDAIEILGEPSGKRILLSSKWELRVKCPLGGINWDVFFYWPTQNYPGYAYGGSIEKIGDWAYVHE